MKSARFYLVLSIVLAAFAGVVAAWCATHYFSSRDQDPSLHRIIHRELGLDETQRAQVAEIEARFSSQRESREREMRAANTRLAAAIEADRELSEDVQASIEDFHHAMGELQMETIRYVFEIRAVLTPEQRARFDATVTAYLTDPDW
jgi:nickel and cobalt resistance protein CnrR